LRRSSAPELLLREILQLRRPRYQRASPIQRLHIHWPAGRILQAS
jgi:hypothetical protein